MKLIRSRILLKAFAVFFILEMVVNIIAPSVTWALTAGPTAPEATSFEPVDTTDMVNTLTGDFVYNVPLLEVPGPSGGYPLSLSYHAGIMPDEEASWVGLGWTLNPGAINRNVNGFADDHVDALNTSRFYWEGGETHEGKIGVTLGVSGVVGVTAEVSVGYDTYQGYGVGFYEGVVAGPARIGMGIDPWGNPYANAGLSTSGLTGGSVNASIGISTDFKTVSPNAGVDVAGMVSVGVSLSTTGGKNRLVSSASVAGFSVNNGKAGRVSSYQVGGTIPLPFISLGYKYRRYWISEMENVKTNGIFHNPTDYAEILKLKNYNTRAYDSYAIPATHTLADREDPRTTNEGSFPSYDDYLINGQGIGGSFKPHMFQGHLYSQNIRHYDDADEKYLHDIVQQPTEPEVGFRNTTMEFRFIDDFSNRYTYETDPIAFNTTDPAKPLLKYDFVTPPVTGLNGNDGGSRSKLAGSKYIQHFTNAQIKNGANGFIETTATGFQRVQTPDEQIGGFKVTNESGVTYHYSLPVYNSDEFQYSERRDDEDVETHNYISKPTKYAYTWLLTAVTGPDYVDRGTGGFDDQDWGYWVDLQYGKWTDQYAWRTPGEGTNIDLDSDFRNFSEGVKELYYLDAIRTKSHTAFFIKDIRDDAKSAVRILRSYMQKVNLSKVEFVTSASKKGGFIPKSVSQTQLELLSGRTISYTAKPVSSLKLDRVILIENKNINETLVDKAYGSSYDQSIVADVSGQSADSVFQQHLADNVLDIHDVSTNLDNLAIRVIKFNSTNDNLVPETINSIPSTPFLGSQNASTNKDDYELKSKLSLNSLEFRGKGGANLIPAMRFSYDYANPQTGSGTIREINQTNTEKGKYKLTSVVGNLKGGDILKFSSNGKTCYATVYKVEAGAFRIQTVGMNQPLLDSTITWTLTKNPPYNSKKVDEWGMYKGDYEDIGNDHVDRVRTNISKNHVDVWSLRQIHSSMGSTINVEYESDIYSKAELTHSYPIIMKDIYFPNSGDVVEVTMNVDVDDASYFYDIGDNVNFYILYRPYLTHYQIGPSGQCEPYYITGYPEVTNSVSGYITKIEGNKVFVRSQCLMGFRGIQYANANGEFECLETYGGGGGIGGGEELPMAMALSAEEPPGEGGGGTGSNGCPVSSRMRTYLGGNMVIYNSKLNIPGGDLRVSKLTVDNGLIGKSKGVVYQYHHVSDTERSSGVTSYAPKILDKYYLEDYDDNSLEAKTLRRVLYSHFSSLLAKATEVPTPGVLYEYVTTREIIKDSNESDFKPVPNYATYHFRVYSWKMNDGEKSNVSIPSNLQDEVNADLDLEYDHDYSHVTKVTLKDFTTQVGELLSVSVFNEDDVKISETTNEYLHDNATNPQFENLLNTGYKNQGVVQETFMNARAIRKEGGKFSLKATLSKRVRYPAIQTGSTTINYRTGTKTTTRNVAFDFYSGQVVKSLATDGHGNSYLTEIKPAYHIYGSMGLGFSGNKNMLTQEASTQVYKVNPSNIESKVGLVSATVQTWTDQIPALEPGAYIPQTANQLGIWRKHASYTFIGDDNVPLQQDGLYPLPVAEFTAWNKNDLAPAVWQKTSEVTLYDVNSHALEAKDINNQFAATKMSFDQSKVMATAANAEYREFGYSGAEDIPTDGQFGNDVQPGTQFDNFAHTGVKSIKAQAGNRGFTFFMVPNQRTYRVSVWSTQSTCEVKYRFDTNNPIQTATVKNVGQAGAWYLLEADINIEDSWDRIEIWCEAKTAQTNFDDFRVCPVDAAMVSYVYNEWGELSHILDNGNLYTEYIYDEMGRLKEVHKETFQAGRTKVSETRYHYAN